MQSEGVTQELVFWHPVRSRDLIKHLSPKIAETPGVGPGWCNRAERFVAEDPAATEVVKVESPFMQGFLMLDCLCPWESKMTL